LGYTLKTNSIMFISWLFCSELTGWLVSGHLMLNEPMCLIISEIFCVQSALYVVFLQSLWNCWNDFFSPVSYVSTLVACLEIGCEQFSNSIKFSKTVLTILSKCQHQVLSNRVWFHPQANSWQP
jgi:hypothetical protein